MMTDSLHPTDIHLENVWKAISNRQGVKMTYFSPGSGQFTERSIEPYGTVLYGNAWHIIAYCQLRQDYRDFRLDRMSKLSILSDCPHRDPLALEEYLEKQSSTTDTTLVKVRVLPAAISRVQQQCYEFGLVKEERQEDYVEMWFMIAQQETFCRWLLTHGDTMATISPPNFC